MMFHRDGERLLVIASNMGAEHHPSWFHNLLADPHVTVEVGDERYAALAVPTVGVDRARVWAELKELYPFFADHEQKTDREIPVVALTRA
jgi:deazaflavin-dependent oxidoreductase (nitroreductase family)